MNIAQFFAQLFGKTNAASANASSAASSEEASLRFLAELQQCCAALPKGQAEVVFADEEFHICMRWKEQRTTTPPDAKAAKALAFWINGENLDVDYQELPWPQAEVVDSAGTAQEETDILTGDVSQDTAVEQSVSAIAETKVKMEAEVQKEKGDVLGVAIAPEETPTKLEAEIPEERILEEQLQEERTLTRHMRAVEKMKAFLLDRYAFRYNCITARTECAPKTDGGIAGPYKAVLQRMQNTLSQELIHEGIGANDHDVKRFVESEHPAIPVFHPFMSYMKQLPAWDGKDRVTSLAQRVSPDGLWVKSFHRWMLAMAAQWMGADIEKVQANNVVPILVSSRQGLGKSTFCRRLLPESLRAYYTDTYDLNNKSAMVSRLISFGLVNLDEFDQIPVSQMAKLKNLLQTEEQHYRRPYSRSEEYLPRIASFIATSNRHDLLTDLTGSRRFLCVEVNKVIDRSPIDYEQLYAQLKEELLEGVRCWFSKEEEAAIQEHNRGFYATTPAEEVVNEHVVFHTNEEEGTCFCSASTLYTLLKKRYGCALHDCTPLAFSKLLSQIAPRVHTRYGNGYWVKLK